MCLIVNTYKSCFVYRVNIHRRNHRGKISKSLYKGVEPANDLKINIIFFLIGLKLTNILVTSNRDKKSTTFFFKNHNDSTILKV